MTEIIISCIDARLQSCLQQELEKVHQDETDDRGC
jgi:hypothetical protein